MARYLHTVGAIDATEILMVAGPRRSGRRTSVAIQNVMAWEDGEGHRHALWRSATYGCTRVTG